MKNEAMKTAVDAFILERINDCGSRPNESLSDTIERLSVCADKLRNTLSAEQRILLTDCENAYSVTDGETNELLLPCRVFRRGIIFAWVEGF